MKTVDHAMKHTMRLTTALTIASAALAVLGTAQAHAADDPTTRRIPANTWASTFREAPDSEAGRGEGVPMFNLADFE
ncbi:hypothetical protein [Streptomyces lavendulae]